MTLGHAYKLIQIILGAALTLQTLEYISLRKMFSENGVWRWSEIRTIGNLHVLDFLFSDKGFPLLLWTRLLCSLAFLFVLNFPVLFFLFLSSLLISIRLRGSFNSGSDYMTNILLSALCVASLLQTEKVMTGVLWYIALQSVTSYFLAGLVKIKQHSWRTGKALQTFAHSPNYNPPSQFIKPLKNHSIAFAASWGVMIFEILFPLVLLLPKTTMLFALAGAFLFHLNNVFFFGLNRFLFAWTATYPAIYFVANRLSYSA